MRNAVEALFNASGLSATTFPWVATLIIHVVLAFYLSGVATVLVRAARLLRGQPVWPWRFATWMLAVVMLVAGLFVAVVLQSFVRYLNSSAVSSAGYEAYSILMFAAACSLFLWLLRRGKFNEGWVA